MNNLSWVPEPKLMFRFGQSMEDPRDGLTLFGPLDEAKPYGIRAGVVGTREGIRRFRDWQRRIQGPILSNPHSTARPFFPGFQAAFGVPWGNASGCSVEIPEDELKNAYLLDDRHQRVFETVEVYARRINQFAREEEARVDLWIVIIPEDVYRYCRPNARVEAAKRLKASTKMTPRKARKLLGVQPTFFLEEMRAAEAYNYDVHFRHQLKARLLDLGVPTQVVRETTIAHHEFVDASGKPIRNLDVLQSAIAWHLSTAVFYKAGGRPWKLASIRDGVCYLGMVFKKDLRHESERIACCAAQMFLDSGDGTVFRGAVGPWYNEDSREFHLSREAARELIELALTSYRERTGDWPKEVFVHGKTAFSDEEWLGFQDAAPPATRLTGVRIRRDSDLKLYRTGDLPVLRGTTLALSDKSAYLWTKGYIPRLLTYPGREVPNPLRIDVCRGEAEISVVLQDILALTKLNYNACNHSDGLPVTLKFADAIGEVLTAGPIRSHPPLPFKFYI